MTTSVLWIGHEAECYILGDTNNFEEVGVALAGYERTGMRLTRSDGGAFLTSTPDWAATNEVWQTWRYNCNGGYTAGFVFWALQNAAGTTLAQIVCTSGTQWKFQVWNGTALVDVGTAQNFVGAGATGRFDVHFLASATGKVEVWQGVPGSQTKQVDASADYSAAANFVRMKHMGSLPGGGYNTDISMDIVQTTSTLNSTSESKPPTSDGADVDGTGGYANVNEQVYSDANVITFTASGQRHSFKAAARTGTQAQVNGVTASCRAWYEAGGASSIKPYLTIGGTRYYGTTFALDLVAKGFQYTWNLDPSTGVAWTTAAANAAALEWGWEVV